VVQAAPLINMRPYLKYNQSKKGWGMTQVKGEREEGEVLHRTI
jgi:hypothetical protein